MKNNKKKSYSGKDKKYGQHKGSSKFPEEMVEGSVRAKKHLGQHFLTDETVAEKIANSLNYSGYKNVLEIGPGMGVLTKYVIKKDIDLHVIEIDRESVAYLGDNFPDFDGKIHEKDFLKYDIKEIFEDEPFAIIGNFPYNISTQIVFKTLEIGIKSQSFRGCFKKK